MKSSVMISQEYVKQIGLTEVFEACHCRTPQGNRLKNSRKFYTPEMRDDLQEELDSIERLKTLVAKNHPEVIEAQTQLSRLRELRGTFLRLEKASLLDDTEFFELKGALRIFFRISRLKKLLVAAGLNFQVTKDASALLDPGGTGNPAFHIYSDYSHKLSQLREQKKFLEKEISKQNGAQRQTLLTQRGLLIAEEDNLEDEIRRDLGNQLVQWLPQMRHNAEICGILDFRLAKADLAVRWQGCQPRLIGSEQPAVIRDAIHPIIDSLLTKQGRVFTPVSIELKQGATVISGANMGGKSVALKTIFLSLLLVQLGYFPRCLTLESPLYDFMAFESSQDGDVHRGLSSFGLEAVQIRNHYERSQHENGLILMDEPCRSTNPAEATAIVQALCTIYGKSRSTLLIATHYQVTPAAGIWFYQVRGIRPEALAELPMHHPKTGSAKREDDFCKSRKREDIIRVRKIQDLMDYRLEVVDGNQQTPSGAIKIAELLGVDQDLLHEMKVAWQEE